MGDGTPSGTDAPRRSDDVAAGLTALLSDHGVPGAVEDLTRLSGGASRDTWACTVRDAAGTRRDLVLQRERGGGAGTSRAMSVQADLLRAASNAGVPVPTLVAVDADGTLVGSPAIVMERIEGETIARRILRDDGLATARGVLVGQVGEALAAVHRISPERVAGLDAVDPLQQMVEVLDLLGEPHPAFELGIRHLRATRPPEVPPRVVHGDFRMGNLVVGPDGLRSVLDWELAHLGDPTEDLGWFCVRAWRFGAAGAAGGLGSVEDLVSAYTGAGGRQVSVDDVRWWEAFGTLRWGVICILQAATHLGGVSRSVELAAIGRRVAENEEDLLELVAGPSDVEPTLASAASVELAGPPHDRPTVGELLDAVGEHLGEVRDGVGGRLGFHARVAGNVVAMIRREVELGADQAAAHRARLDRLGVVDDVELAAAIRSGAMDGRLGEVTEAVRCSVRDKLAVSNPGYWRRP